MSSKTLNSEEIRNRIAGNKSAAGSLVNAFQTNENGPGDDKAPSSTSPSPDGSRDDTTGVSTPSSSETFEIGQEKRPKRNQPNLTLDPKALAQAGYTKREKYVETHTARTYYIKNQVLDELPQYAKALNVDLSRFVNDALEHYMKFLKGE